MKILRLAVALLFLASQTACVLGPRVDTLGPAGYGPLNQLAAQQPARLVMRDGRQVGARGLVLAEGTASWTDADTGAPRSVALGDVAEVRLRSHARGARIGWNWGVLLGAIFGSLWGLSEGTRDSAEPSETGAVGAVYGGMAFGVLGGLSGLSVGAIIGTDDVYRVPPPPPGAPSRLLEGGSAKP